MKGIYQHCGENHLHRYLAEYEFRYSYREANGFNDGDRSRQALKGIVGKRLMGGLLRSRPSYYSVKVIGERLKRWVR